MLQLSHSDWEVIRIFTQCFHGQHTLTGELFSCPESECFRGRVSRGLCPSVSSRGWITFVFLVVSCAYSQKPGQHLVSVPDPCTEATGSLGEATPVFSLVRLFYFLF